jgi:hypothetical protein
MDALSQFDSLNERFRERVSIAFRALGQLHDPKSSLHRYHNIRGRIGDHAMSTNILIVAAIREDYELIMDTDKNRLKILQPSQRFQAMITICFMSTTIFCTIFGIWMWFWQIIALHLLVLGIAETGMTFEHAARTNVESKIEKQQ